LPLFLEFLSYLTKNEAAEFLGDTVNILSVLEKRLNGSRSLYGIIFSALLTLTAKKPNRDKVQEALQKESKHKKTLDEAWEETPVDFGPSSSCHSDTGEVVINIDQLKRKR
jgi:nitrate reductase molybdenum cofactor assembly chaperone NarJ/NarW